MCVLFSIFEDVGDYIPSAATASASKAAAKEKERYRERERERERERDRERVREAEEEQRRQSYFEKPLADDQEVCSLNHPHMLIKGPVFIPLVITC